MTNPVREATAFDAPLVGALIHKLICEIAPQAADDISLDAYQACAARLLAQNDRYWALLAAGPNDASIGLLTLNECAAIYAGGRFGEIPELYVEPSHRSQGVAADLVRAAIAFAKQRDW